MKPDSPADPVADTFSEEWCVRHGVMYLRSKHLGGVGNKIGGGGGSKPALLLNKIKASLSYMEPTSNKMK